MSCAIWATRATIERGKGVPPYLSRAFAARKAYTETAAEQLDHNVADSRQAAGRALIVTVLRPRAFAL